MNYVYVKLPRFDGRKTLAFNGLVFLVACGWLTAAYSGLSGFGPVGETGLIALAAVAALNGLLRVVTSRPVWWREYRFIGVDLAGEGCDKTVYHKAAEFVAASGFTDHKIRDNVEWYERRRTAFVAHNADFQRDLDQQLCDARRDLPLDADQDRN